MRPTCERPTMERRSKSSKDPVAFANASRSRSRNTPSGRFISKMGRRPEVTSHDGSLTGMVTETARVAGVSGRYRKVLPRALCLSIRPASAPSVQTLIIAVLFYEFIQCWPVGAGGLELQFQPKDREESGYFGISKLTGAAVLQGVERCPTDTRHLRQFRLAQPQAAALCGNLRTKCQQIHMPNISCNMSYITDFK